MNNEQKGKKNNKSKIELRRMVRYLRLFKTSIYTRNIYVCIYIYYNCFGVCIALVERKHYSLYDNNN